VGVDLRICEKGDILITVHGLMLKYVGPLPEENYFDHEVEYPEENVGYGTRTHEGYVFRKKRLPEDQDIAKIIKKKDWKKIFE